MTSEQVQRRRQAHHKALEALALQVGCKTPGLKLWRQLARLEKRLLNCCLNYSNHASYGTERWQKDKDQAREELKRIFGGTIPQGVYINGDPRGSMLKLDSGSAGEPGVAIPEGMQTDLGQDGMLAATIEEES